MLSELGMNDETLRDPLLTLDERRQIDDENNDDDEGTVVVTNGRGSVMNNANTTSIFYKTLFPDTNWVVSERIVLEGGFPVKLTKFLLLTFCGIFWLHWLVGHRQNHRNEQLEFWHLWVFDGELIVRDSLIFFLVGRLWRRRGVDHLAWFGIVLACNLFLEVQHYVPWLQHSMTPYEMNCNWYWQTWGYMVLCIVISSGILLLHIRKAWRDKVLLLKATEMTFFTIVFLVPVIPSPYFHFHHWFAGWLLGMHSNFDVWWSRAAMAWCHGLYINGIAVYGRSPVLTCEYAYFLSWDQRCPFLFECESDDLANSLDISSMLEHLAGLYVPANWRNCSDSRYHP